MTSIRVRSVVLGISIALLGAACAGGEQSGATSAGPVAPAVEVAPPPPVTPPPSAPSAPEPPVMQRMVRSLPGAEWDPNMPLRNTEMQPFDADRHPEVGQTLEVAEAFELQRVGVSFSPPTVALPGFREIYYDGIDWGRVVPYVDILEPSDALDVTLSIILYRSPSPEGFPTVARMAPGVIEVPSRVREVITVDALEIVTDQRLVGTVRTDDMSFLDLTEPVVLEPGRWLVAFRIEGVESGVDIINLPIVGLESASPPDVVIRPDLPCEFVATPDPTPDHAFYFRTTLGDGLEVFTPGFGKVQGDCVVAGYYFSPAGTGDIGLDLFGVPVG